MCPSKVYIPRSGPGRRRSIADPNVRDSIRELRALTDRMLSSSYSFSDVKEYSAASYLLQLSRSQSLLLADLATMCASRLTWSSIAGEPGSWVMFGEAGEASGPRLTVCISVTSDRQQP